MTGTAALTAADILCTRLADVVERDGGRRPAITQEWQRQAKLLLDRDKRSLTDAVELIDWCFQHPYWHHIIRTLTKFRQRYDQLATEARTASGGHLSLGDVQRRAWANKLAKGFNIDNVPLEICYLLKELAEIFEAWCTGGDVGEEIADLVIFAGGFAEMTGYDLDTEVTKKLDIIARRVYTKRANGTNQRISDTPEATS